MSESLLDHVRLSNNLTMKQYHDAWVPFGSDRSDNPKINEREKRFRPRKICMLGCCLTQPRAAIALDLVSKATSLVKNLARLCRKHQEKAKGHLAPGIALFVLGFCVLSL